MGGGGGVRCRDTGSDTQQNCRGVWVGNRDALIRTAPYLSIAPRRVYMHGGALGIDWCFFFCVFFLGGGGEVVLPKLQLDTSIHQNGLSMPRAFLHTRGRCTRTVMAISRRGPKLHTVVEQVLIAILELWVHETG